MFLGQLFELSDIPRLIFLTFLEIVLSADNAVVLALLTHVLPIHLRRKALWIGTLSAFIFRAGAIFFLSLLLQHLWVQILGGIYLVYLAIHHFFKRKKKTLNTSPSFWKTVLLVELFDLAFAIDSIVASLAFIAATPAAGQGTLHPKLWIVYFGGMLGLVVIRYAADLMSRLIDHFPRLETNAYLMIGWIGLKLIFAEEVGLWFEPVFWTVLIGLFLLGLKKK